MTKTILITGASTGIGRATAEYFANKGWNVAATMRNPEKNNLKEKSNLIKLKLDVIDKKSIKKAVSDTIKKFGKIDVLLNNAGYGAFGPVESATDEQIRRQFDVNVFGLLDVSREVLPYMRKAKSGIIINVSSVVGKVSMPLGSLYVGTKFCIEGISESMNFELNPLGIKVRLVEPGGVDTDFSKRSLVMFDNKIKDYDYIVSKKKNSSPNIGFLSSTSEDVAKVIYKAATSKSNKLRYIAGKDAKLAILIKSIFGSRAIMSVFKKRM